MKSHKINKKCTLLFHANSNGVQNSLIVRRVGVTDPNKKRKIKKVKKNFLSGHPYEKKEN
jgi:hypothetical protein